jgi:hypothetical protein
MQLSSTPTQPSIPPLKSPWYRRTSIPDILLSICLLTFFLSWPVVYVADRVWSLHLTNVWTQLGASLVAVLLLALAIGAKRFRLSIRFLFIAGAFISIAFVIDALDGKPDILPLITLLLAAWGITFGQQSRTLVRYQQRASFTWWFGCLVGMGATILYIFAATYYLVLNQLQGPQISDQHPLFGIAYLIIFVLRSITTTIQKQTASDDIREERTDTQDNESA